MFFRGSFPRLYLAGILRLRFLVLFSNLKRYQHVFGQIKETEDKHVDMNLFGLLGIIFWCVISLSCDACCNLISNFTTPDIRYGSPVPCCSKAD